MTCKIGVCGIACERCPRMTNKTCPNYPNGCTPKQNPFCKIATCAHQHNIHHCFDCPHFPCDTTKTGPISYGYCQYLAGKQP